MQYLLSFFIIYFLNKSKWNILLKGKNDSPRIRCAKVMNRPKFDTNQDTYRKVATIKKMKKLHNTHTTKWVSPQMMKIKGNGHKMRRQP